MEFLFADDCEIISHSVDDLQKIMTIFHEVSNKFGQQISVKKTEILVVQPRKAYFLEKPEICVDGQILNVVNTFKYVGGTENQTASLDSEITTRILRMAAALSKLESRTFAMTI